MVPIGRALTSTEDQAVRGELTKNVYLYAKEETKEVKFYGEDHTGAITHVPRIYAIRNLSVTPSSDTKVPMSKKLQFKGNLIQTKNRPQVEAYTKTLHQLKSKFGATLVLQPGSGKTVIALALSLALQQTTVILCHKGFLLEQWKCRIKEFVEAGHRVGEIRQGCCITEGCDFVLASLQSLACRNYPPKNLSFGLVICDETHHMPSTSFTKALSKLSYFYSLGLTGTPRRSDGLGSLMYELIGRPSFIHSPPKNVSVQVNLILYKPRCLNVRKCRNGKLNMAAMMTDLVQDKVRNQCIARIAAKMYHLRENGRRKGLLLSHRVSHLECLYKLMVGFGVELKTGTLDSTQVGGKRKKKSRSDVEFKSWLTLSTYSLFSEGVDFNGDFIILGSPKSDVEQSVGRILRGKNKDMRPLVVDIGDEWSCFKGQMRKRQAFYKKRGFEVIRLKATSLGLTGSKY